MHPIQKMCIFAVLIRLTGNRPVSKTDSTPALMTVSEKAKKNGGLFKSPFFVPHSPASGSFAKWVSGRTPSSRNVCLFRSTWSSQSA